MFFSLAFLPVLLMFPISDLLPFYPHLSSSNKQLLFFFKYNLAILKIWPTYCYMVFNTLSESLRDPNCFLSFFWRYWYWVCWATFPAPKLFSWEYSLLFLLCSDGHNYWHPYFQTEAPKCTSNQYILHCLKPVLLKNILDE